MPTVHKGSIYKTVSGHVSAVMVVAAEDPPH